MHLWDVSVFLDVAFEVSVARMARRDGSHPDPAHPSNRRYVDGQRLYLSACAPSSRATFVVPN
jgi:uridine kinase